MKQCITCKQNLALECFPPNKKNKDGLNVKCRDCFNSYMREWYQKNADKHKARVALSRNKELERARRYGLTAKDVDDMLAKYKGKCYLCRVKPATCIDHDHKTNIVRGMLCYGCNSGLGKLGDSIEGLTKAIEYLAHGADGLTH